MTEEISEEAFSQVRNLFLMDSSLAKEFVPLMSDEALEIARDIIAIEDQRRQEKRDDSPQEG